MFWLLQLFVYWFKTYQCSKIFLQAWLTVHTIWALPWLKWEAKQLQGPKHFDLIDGISLPYLIRLRAWTHVKFVKFQYLVKLIWEENKKVLNQLMVIDIQSLQLQLLIIIVFSKPFWKYVFQIMWKSQFLNLTRYQIDLNFEFFCLLIYFTLSFLKRLVGVTGKRQW